MFGLRCFGLAVFVLAFVFDDFLLQTFLLANQRYTFALLETIQLVQPNPFGWKLEPRLSEVFESFISYYIRLYALIFPMLVKLKVPLILIYAGSLGSFFFDNGAGFLVFTMFLVFFSLFAPVAVLFFLAKRTTWFLLGVMVSLANLFRGRFYSKLKLRQEPLSPSLDTLLLGLFVFAATLLLIPVFLVNVAVLFVFHLPLYLAGQLLAKVSGLHLPTSM